MIEQRYTGKGWNSSAVGYFHDTKSKRDYKLILGGMAWPSIGDGGAVVIGQAMHKNPQTRERDVWILAEKQGNHFDLFEFMSDCSWKWLCSKWYGDGFHEPNMALMHKWNQKMFVSDPVSLIDAPFVEKPDSFQAYYRIVDDLLLSECKVLQLHGSSYAAQLQAVPDLAIVKPQEHPGFLALGYAVAALQVYGHTEAKFHDVGYEPLEERIGI